MIRATAVDAPWGACGQRESDSPINARNRSEPVAGARQGSRKMREAPGTSRLGSPTPMLTPMSSTSPYLFQKK